LTCHAIGNWGKAELGGKDATLVLSSAFLLRNYLLELEKQKLQKNLDFEVTLECTHHGPFLSKPTVFIELGSSEEQWSNAIAAQAVAETIAKATSLDCNSAVIPAIGVGGTHYCSEFSKLVLRKPFAFSHICPEYALQNFNEALLQQAVACSLEKPQLVVIDWKGLGKQKEKILSLFSNQSLPIERVQNLLK
jgi:D-aminoacyl-tRNA deacylase